MTEEEKFGAWANGAGYDTANTHDQIQGIWLNPMTKDLWTAWQAAIASRDPAKDIDMEALKQGQENAAKAWAGVDVEKFLQREPQPMPIEKAEEIAHRTASRYTHKSDKSFTAYTFLPHTLEQFVRLIEKFHGIG